MSDKNSSKSVADEKPVENVDSSKKTDTAPYLKAKTTEETTGKSPSKSHRFAFSISAIALMGVIVYLASQLFQEQFKQGLAQINEVIDNTEIVKSIDSKEIVTYIDNAISGVIDSITTSYAELVAGFENDEASQIANKIVVNDVKTNEFKTIEVAKTVVAEEAPATEVIAITPVAEEVASTPVDEKNPVTEEVATTHVAEEAPAPLHAQTTVPAPMARTQWALPYGRHYATPYGYRPYHPAFSMPPAPHAMPQAQNAMPRAQRQAFEAMMKHQREAFENAMRQREEAMKHVEVMRSAVYRDMEKSRADSVRRMEEQRIRMQIIREQSFKDMQERYRAMGEHPRQG